MRRFAPLLPLVLIQNLASADPAPDTTAALVSAAVTAGDWRKHPIDPASPSGEITPLLALDLRGARIGDGRVRLAATGVAFAGASLIAASHHDRWCSGPGCAIGAAALLVVAPLLQAAAREGR
jgi:hypothetical protein